MALFGRTAKVAFMGQGNEVTQIGQSHQAYQSIEDAASGLKRVRWQPPNQSCIDNEFAFG